MLYSRDTCDYRYTNNSTNKRELVKHVYFVYQLRSAVRFLNFFFAKKKNNKKQDKMRSTNSFGGAN